MASFNNEIRKFSSDQLYDMLKAQSYGASEQFISCDELLLRNKPILGLSISFESLVRSLSFKDLQFIDQHDFEFSPASIMAAILELRLRNEKRRVWYIQNQLEQAGPLDHLQLTDKLKDVKFTNVLVWAEGMSEWKKLADLPHLNRTYFFDQHQLVTIRKEKTIEKPIDSSAVPLVSGILQFFAMPFWIVLSVVAPINGIWSYTGIALPAFFSGSMALLSIPIAVGLIMARRWAYLLKIGTGLIVITWFLSKILIDDSSHIWLIMGCYELIIIIFVFSRSKYFN